MDLFWVQTAYNNKETLPKYNWIAELQLWMCFEEFYIVVRKHEIYAENIFNVLIF